MAEHPDGGFWRRSRRSTGIPLSRPKAEAISVARELERVSNEVRTAKENPARFFERSVARLLLSAGIEQPRKACSWADYSRHWLAERKIAPNSRTSYLVTMERFSRYLGARAKADLRHITHEDCAGFLAHLEQTGLSPATCRFSLMLVRSIFERARLQGFCDMNPAKLIELDRTHSQHRQPFTSDELSLIFLRIKHECHEWRIACLFGLYYGLRLRDATGRSYSEIRQENGRRIICFVPMKKRRKGHPISLPLVGELARLKGSGLITPKLAKLGNPSLVFSGLLRRAGITVKRTKVHGDGYAQSDKTFHSLRHTCNTMLLNGGVDARLRQLISDHESAAMNARYTHVSVDAMAEAINKAIKLPK